LLPPRGARLPASGALTPATVATVACPTCGKSVEWHGSAPWRPFCSERCKLIDLGEWMSERHRIPGEPADEGESTAEPPAPTDPT
jgi:hypothetical protein